MAARILDHVRRHGVTHPRDLRATLGKVSIGNGWGGNSAATTRMLEALQYCGKLRVARREAGIRLYALAEARPRPRAAATRAADVLALLLRSLRAAARGEPAQARVHGQRHFDSGGHCGASPRAHA